MLEHGGRRRAAARRYGIPEADWLDLSTGINPQAYPVPPLDADDWRRLPEDDDGLLETACACYGAHRVVALAGSQPAIQSLPFLLPRGRVAVLAPTYAEHAWHWQRAGHAVRRFAAHELAAVADTADAVVLCNPNNPDAALFAPEALVAAAERLQVRGGHLIVDEAFVDAMPERSVIAQAGRGLPGLVVLRSLGKFFGLAGARVGFVAAAPALRDALAEAAGPWPLGGPARKVALAALADRDWQAAARHRLAADSARLAALLAPLAGDPPPRVHPLFVWLPTPHATQRADALAQAGILVRHFDDPATPEARGLRVGLPATGQDWRRLEHAIDRIAAAARNSA